MNSYRYIIKNERTGEIYVRVWHIFQIESGFVEDFVEKLNEPLENISFLSRDAWTGLHDSKDKKVFEGDIIRAPQYNPEYMKISFIEGGFCATYKVNGGYPIDIDHFYPSIGCMFEVVGNVVQNPELAAELV